MLAAAVAVGCTQDVQLDDRLAGLVALSIAPGQSSLAIDGLDAPAQSVTFTATGQFSDGSARDITAFVTWSVDDPAPGSIADGVYTATGAAGGRVTVTAATQGQSASAALTVVVTATIVDATFPPPGDPETLFPAGVQPITGDAMHAPSVLYPVDGTMFPQGVVSTLVQYAPGMANDSFRIALDSDVLHLVVYTGAPRWSADGAVWSLIGASGIADPVELSIEATDSQMLGTIYAGAPATLQFSPDQPGGALYYWSSAQSGIMRGALAAPSAGKLYPGDATCVGCHAVSRDASQLAMGYADENNPMLQTIQLGSLASIIDASQNVPGGWTSYSPDGSVVVVAHDGALALRDARTGAGLGSPTGAVMLPPMTFATHPDWSPDGSAVAVALTKMPPTDKDVNGASIAVLPFDGATFGAPQIVVAATGNENDYFPRWSPDGRYLAYVHATSSSHAAMTAELRLVAATGGAPTILAAASHRVAMGPGANLFDTMPTWSPASGQLAWLAFASVRPYGAVMPMGNQAQIWITALDLGNASDPSFAAFWLPCQDITKLNNNPVWTGSSSSEVGRAN
ncbi:MAG TPA: hypothetical protein VLX92_03715 [Kofleriaceae bacterium]|nr:hypothetical protein [Kofleriaceae bacterium]